MDQLLSPVRMVGATDCETVEDKSEPWARVDLHFDDVVFTEPMLWLFLQSISEITRTDGVSSSERFGTMIELGLSSRNGRVVSLRLVGPGEPVEGISTAERMGRHDLPTIADQAVPCLRPSEYGLGEENSSVNFLMPSLKYFPGESSDVIQLCESTPSGVVRVGDVEFALGEDLGLYYIRWEHRGGRDRLKR